MHNLIKHYHQQYKRINYHDRTMLMSAGSFLINALLGAGKLLLGIVLLSPWFIATAVYYLLLCAARGQLLWRFRSTRRIKDPQARFDLQFTVFRRSGLLLCLLATSYLLVCSRMYYWNEGTTYPYYIVYGVAGVAFYKIGMAIYGIIVGKGLKNPLFSTMKIIAFADACTSIVAIQYALLTMQGSGASAAKSSALLGSACSILFFGIGIYMMLRRKSDRRSALHNVLAQ